MGTCFDLAHSSHACARLACSSRPTVVLPHSLGMAYARDVRRVCAGSVMGEPARDKGKLPRVDAQPAPASAAAGNSGEAHELTCAICLDNIALEELSIIKGCEHAYCSAWPCWSWRCCFDSACRICCVQSPRLRAR